MTLRICKYTVEVIARRHIDRRTCRHVAVGPGGVQPLRSQAFQPGVVVLVQAGFIIVDEDGSGNVHGIYQHFAIPTSYPLELPGI